MFWWKKRARARGRLCDAPKIRLVSEVQKKAKQNGASEGREKRKGKNEILAVLRISQEKRMGKSRIKGSIEIF